MIHNGISPIQQKQLRDNVDKYFWKSSTILDYIQRGIDSYVLGKVQYKPQDEEYRIWKSSFGIVPQDEPAYLGIYKSAPEAQGAFSELLSELVEPIETKIRPRNDSALVNVSELSDDYESFLDTTPDSRLEEILEKRKENFISNAVKYDYISDISKTYVVGYVGLSEDDINSEWRIWVTEKSPNSIDGEFLFTELEKEEALDIFYEMTKELGLPYNDFTEQLRGE